MALFLSCEMMSGVGITGLLECSVSQCLAPAFILCLLWGHEPGGET